MFKSVTLQTYVRLQTVVCGIIAGQNSRCTNSLSLLFLDLLHFNSLFVLTEYSSNSTWLDSTRLDTFDVSSPCILAVSS